MHEAVHVALLVLFLGAAAGGFLGLIRPLVDDGAGPRAPGTRATFLLFAAAAAALAADWLVHRFVI